MRMLHLARRILATATLMFAGCSFATSMILDEAARPRPLQRIGAGPAMPNPAVAGLPRMVDGHAVQEPDEVTIHGQQFGAALAGYRDDALCVMFATARESSRASGSQFDADLSHHYQLVAPAEMIDPSRAPFMEASSVRPTGSAGSYDHSNLEVKDDTLIISDRYRVGETWAVCFDHVSRVLTPRSKYALVRFRDDEGHVRFAYSWRFSKAS
jgi:hypothetical protein